MDEVGRTTRAAIGARLGTCALAAAVMTLGSGCPKRFETVKPALLTGPSASGGVELLLVADNHATNSAGMLTRERSVLADKLGTNVSLRPAQVDLWGQQVLDWVLERELREHAPEMLVHLGDLANISCTEEARTTLETLRRRAEEKGVPWFAIPGNHDGFYMGNQAYNPVQCEEDGSCRNFNSWSGACNHAGQPMNKDDFIELYLRELGSAGYLKDIEVRLKEISAGGCLELESQKPPLTRLVTCMHKRPTRRTKDGAPNIITYDSFLIQQVALRDGRSAVLLDTSQYDRRLAWHSLVSRVMAGLVGQVRTDQLEIVRRWIAQEQARRAGPVLLIGHYPLAELERQSRKALLGFAATGMVLGYLSGHVHAPSEVRDWFVPNPVSDKPLRLTELNVGSLVDWPMEYGRLQIAPNGAGLTTASWKPVRLADPSFGLPEGSAPVCDASWEEKEGSAAWYREYADKKYAYYDQQAAASSRFLGLPESVGVLARVIGERDAAQQDVGQKPQKEKMKALAAIQREIAVPSRWADDGAERARNYALCQTRWATIAEHRHRAPAEALVSKERDLLSLKGVSFPFGTAADAAAPWTAEEYAQRQSRVREAWVKAFRAETLGEESGALEEVDEELALLESRLPPLEEDELEQ
ncbi:MAG: metallophosphoesterase [Deltaproteobacteria bacterium]|nr:metallophosphoesterase [Deltaproteobacteria bacterium]